MLTVEDLDLNGLKIVQDDGLYKFTSDAIMLSRFARAKKGDVVADYCSGSGIVGLHFYGLNPDVIKSVTLFELQKPLYELSLKTIEINGLDGVFTAINTPLQEISSEYANKFSLIVCNPPYATVQSGALAPDQSLAVCKSEVMLTLKELVKAMAFGLKFGGRVCMCHRADRLADIICEFRANGIEPKRLQTVAAGQKQPYLIMIEGVKGGKSGLQILSPISN